ncbi:putative T7SS-secreted protein [Nocardia asteroides]|uniref:putative T7SS-secreted protein n=1 Tax=Nocardia asteroides TaxID=1824 RepID=UPI0036650BDB
MGIGDFLNSVGDKIEDGLESATEKAGQVYNTVLDAESRVAKAVGADWLSGYLDDMGDKIVDATGGAVPEKELGETTDPKELIRGDVAKINEVAEHLGTIGTAIDQTGDALRKIDVADWSGSAASAFHDEYSKQPKLWWDGADAMAKAKTALAAWSAEVTAAQAKASDAISKWEAADREERDRKNEWNAKSDEDRKGKNLTDTWTDMRNEARAILTGARTQRDNAANTAVAAIAAATETAPTEPPFLSRWGSNFEDLDAALDQAKLNFSSGLLTSLTGMVQFVRSISPIDAYNVTHPAEYMSKMSDLGTGMVLAAADPKATAGAMLAGFKTNPSEALGALTGDALMTVATGGAGGAAKAGARVVDDVADTARLGTGPKGAAHNPDGPTTQPAATTPDKPAPTKPEAEAPAANPDAPTKPVGHGDAPAGDPDVPPPPDNLRATDPDAPVGDDVPARDGSPEAPATTPDNGGAASPETPRVNDDGPAQHGDADNGPANDPETPRDRNDGEPDPNSPGIGSPEHSGNPADGDAPADNPNSHGDDAGPRKDDGDDATQPGGLNPENPGTPDQLDNTKPELRANTDTGGAGEPSVGEAGQRNPPETDSTPDQSTECRDPVNVATGEFLLPLTDIELPGILRLALKRSHRSSYRYGRWFGPSWSATLDMRVVLEEDCVTVVFEDGMLVPYPHAEIGVGVEPITGGQRWKLTCTDTGGYRLWDPDRELVWHFAPEPSLNGLDIRLGNFAISAITDRHNNRIRFHYNSNGDPTKVTHSGGYKVVLDSADGRVTALSLLGEADGVETTTCVREFGYEEGELTSVVNGVGGVTRFAYDNQHRMLSWTDSNGSWISNSYDEFGRVSSQRGISGVMNSEFEYVEFGNGTGKLTRVTNSRGGSTGYGFDTDLRLRDVVMPDGGRRHIDYNPYRKPLSVTEPDGAVTRYEYSADGDVTKITRPDGSEVSIDYAYTNRPSTIASPDGTLTQREWNKSGNLIAVTDQAGARTQYSHDKNGAVTEVCDADGGITRIEVDAAGLPTSISDPFGARTEIQRDSFGRPTRVTDPLGNTTSYEWTLEGKPARRIDPDGYFESWVYDGENNLLAHTDRNGGNTTYTYSHYDRVSTRTDPDGSTYRYFYNTELQLTVVVNPLGQRWTYDYDATGRLVAETDYTGATTVYTHTSTGRIATVTPATGVTRHHRYDILGNLTSIVADTGEYLSYTHDPAGRILTAVNGTSESRSHTLEFTYSPTGRVTTQKLDEQPPMVNEYDHRGRRARRTTPTGSTTTWRHNTLGQVIALTAEDTDITFDHDRAGRLAGWRIGEVRVDRTFTPNGNIASQHVTGFPSLEFTLDLGDSGQSSARRRAPFTMRRDDFTYRPDGYLTQHTTTRPDTGVSHANYTLDSIGRVNTITRDNAIAEVYEYDALSNITASSANAPAGPDPATPSPRRMVGREYHNNLLVRDGRNHYYYDPAGRLIRKVTTRISRKPSVWHYQYNAFDQLTDVFTPAQEWWKYSYDAYGRRTAKHLHKGRPETAASHRTYNWDGVRLVEERHSGSTTHWHHQPGSFAPIGQTESGPGGSRFTMFICSNADTPAEIIEPRMARTEAYAEVELWGETTWRGQSSSSVRFPGQIYDAETGLHQNFRRYYDSATGRYLTPDPLGLPPSPNPNTYPHNPTGWSDPLGLAPDPCTGADTDAGPGPWDMSGRDPMSVVPDHASVRELTPDSNGGAQYGLEYKWVDSEGRTVRLRIHGPDGNAPAGSNAASGETYRIQFGGKYQDAAGNLHPRNVHNSNSPHYNPNAANDSHIPWPSEYIGL